MDSHPHRYNKNEKKLQLQPISLAPPSLYPFLWSLELLGRLPPIRLVGWYFRSSMLAWRFCAHGHTSHIRITFIRLKQKSRWGDRTTYATVSPMPYLHLRCGANGGSFLIRVDDYMVKVDLYFSTGSPTHWWSMLQNSRKWRGSHFKEYHDGFALEVEAVQILFCSLWHFSWKLQFATFVY